MDNDRSRAKAAQARRSATSAAATPCSCAMLRRTARQVTQDYDQAMRPVGLRLSQYSVLANVARQGGLTITRLAAGMGLDRTTLTRNLRPLVKAGWVRFDATGDKRAQAVHLTAAGKAVLKRAQPLWRQAERGFRERMGAKRLNAMRELLDAALAKQS